MTGAARILERCVPNGDCLLFTGAVNSRGYGSVASGVKGRTALAHRVVYTETVGPIPADMTVDHLCMNKLCQNTAHMEIVTRAENSRRKVRSQTHCKNGHRLAGANIRLARRKNGHEHRVCKPCAREYNREWMRANRATGVSA